MNDVKKNDDFKKIVDLDKEVQLKDIKIFLGEYNGFQRYDVYKHPFAKIIERSRYQRNNHVDRRFKSSGTKGCERDWYWSYL